MVQAGSLSADLRPRVREHEHTGETGDLEDDASEPATHRSPDRDARLPVPRRAGLLRPSYRSRRTAGNVHGSKERKHQGSRDGGADQGDHQDRPRSVALPPQQQADEDERPDQVELLFDRQRPCVLQRRWSLEQREVVLRGEHRTPVRDVTERGKRISAVRSISGADAERDAVHGDAHEHATERREQAPASRAQNEPREIRPVPSDSTRSKVVMGISRQDEEQVHAQVTTREIPAVEEQHAGDGRASEAVECGYPWKDHPL